ncbi:Fc.00g085100.m01.CDS01 [Cosmosporella sp. VM-42]
MYRGLNDEYSAHQHEWFLVSFIIICTIDQTIESVKVKFIGVIDTVKTVRDGNLYDIEQTPNVLHIRHALAMFECRNLFSPKRYKKPEFNGDTRSVQCKTDQTCVEAWFLGGHGNVGGAMVEDGLALWPLQYFFSEAQKQGLELGFRHLLGVPVADPIKYAMPDDEHSIKQQISFKNGATIDI